MKLVKLVAALGLSVSLVACTSVETVDEKPQQQGNLAQSAVIAVSSPDVTLTGDMPLSWYPEDVLIVDEANPLYNRLYARIKQQIRYQLEIKGYRFAPAGTQTNRQVVVVAIAGDQKEVQAMEELFQLYPNLNSDDKDLAQGTVLVAVIDPARKKAAWRGAMQVLSKREDIPEQQRMQRIDLLMARLMRSLESAYSLN